MSDIAGLIERLNAKGTSRLIREKELVTDKETGLSRWFPEVRSVAHPLCAEAADALADLQAKLDVATADISACRALLGEAAQVLENVGKHKPGWGEPDDWPVVGRLKGARYPLNGDCVRAAALAAKIRERLG